MADRESATISAASAKSGGVLVDWTGLTRERHKSLLIDDFVNPDCEARRIGAYRRLAYYYPEAVKAPSPETTGRTETLMTPSRNEISLSESSCTACGDDQKERRRLFDAFIAEHGELILSGHSSWNCSMTYSG